MYNQMVNTVNTNSFIKNTINNNGSSVVVYSNSIDANTTPTVFSSGINRNDDNFVISQGSDLLLPVLKISSLGNVEIQNDLIVKGNTSINNTNNQYFEDSNIDLGLVNNYTIKNITDVTTTSSSAYSYPNSASYSSSNKFYLFTSDFSYTSYNSTYSALNAQYNYNTTTPILINGVKDSNGNTLSNINKLNAMTNVIIGFGASVGSITKSVKLNDFLGGSPGNSFWNRNNYSNLNGLSIKLVLSSGSDSNTYFISNATYNTDTSIFTCFLVLNLDQVVSTSTDTANADAVTPNNNISGILFNNSFIVKVAAGTAPSTTSDNLKGVITGQVVNNTVDNSYGITWNYCSTGGVPLTKSVAFDSDATGTGGSLNINSSDSNGDAKTYFKFDYNNKKFKLLNPTDSSKYNSLQLDGSDNTVFTTSGDYTINANATDANAYKVVSSGGVTIGATGSNGALALNSSQNMSQTAAGTMSQTSTGAMTQTASGDMSINANSSTATAFAVSSAGGVAIGATGTNGSLALTSFKAMSQTATGDMSISANSSTATSFAVSSAGGVTIGATGTNGSLALTSFKDMSQTATGAMTQTSTGAMTHTASGDMSINANSTTSSAFAVSSAGGVAIGATGTNGSLALTSFKAMSQTAAGDMSINANSTTAAAFAVSSAGGVAIAATGTNGSLALTSFKAMSQTAAGDMSISANSTTATAFAVSSAGGVAIAATGTNGSLALTSFKTMSQTATGDMSINANSSTATSFAVSSAGGVAIGATGTNGTLALTSFKAMSQTASDTLTQTAAGDFTINANATTSSAFAVSSAGGVAIGATGTNGSLTLNSYKAMNIGLGATNGMIITSNAAATNSNYVLQMYCGSTRLYWFDNLGNHTALSSVSALSDNRLKTNIQPIDNCLDKVMKLNSVYFNWTDPERSSHRNIGLIAQNVQEVVPELVNTSDEYLSVNYAQMVSVLIGAIQEQQKQIDELKAKLA